MSSLHDATDPSTENKWISPDIFEQLKSKDMITFTAAINLVTHFFKNMPRYPSAKLF
jgi:hypothetical protein